MSNKILVIDDEKDLTDLLSFHLKKEGFECLTALDGEDGLKKTRAEKPDLIVLDLMMPGIDGYEVAKRLKGDSATQDIPIIVLTAAVRPDLEVSVFHIGAMDCVVKPFESDELIEKIRKALVSR